VKNVDMQLLRQNVGIKKMLQNEWKNWVTKWN
jgi:hypothetical protein